MITVLPHPAVLMPFGLFEGGNSTCYLCTYTKEGHQITIQASGAAYDSMKRNPPQMRKFLLVRCLFPLASKTLRANKTMLLRLISLLDLEYKIYGFHPPILRTVTISNVSVTHTVDTQINYGDVINSEM